MSSLLNKLLLFLGLIFCIPISGQTADSTVVNTLRENGITFSNDNRVVLLTTGQEKFDDLFTAIRQAKSSIHLEYFNFRNDSIAGLLFRILKEKVKEGVEVRAIFDAFGNASNNKPLKQKQLDIIRSWGIEIIKFDPIRFPWVNHVFSRDHRKIVVIDGEIGYIGGMNVANYYITGTKKTGAWKDMHCRIQGLAVNSLQKIFLHTWNKISHQNVQGAKYYRGYQDKDYFKDLKPDTSLNAGHKMIGIINREPLVSNKIIRTFYTTAINAAKDSIKIVNPYFTLKHGIKKALDNALKRGVKIELMLSTRSDIPLTPDCGFYNAHKLMKRGANVWMYEGGFHHTKVIMVDGRVCTVGSANLNSRSLSWDYEANAVIIDKCTTKELDSLFDSEKKDSFLLTPETWNQFRTPWQKFRGWVAHLLAPVL